MKILRVGLLPKHWRLVRDLKESISCVHGRSLSEAECIDCLRELEYDGDDDRPWRSSQEGAKGEYCTHDVPLDERCAECVREMEEGG